MFFFLKRNYLSWDDYGVGGLIVVVVVVVDMLVGHWW